MDNQTSNTGKNSFFGKVGAWVDQNSIRLLLGLYGVYIVTCITANMMIINRVGSCECEELTEV